MQFLFVLFGVPLTPRISAWDPFMNAAREDLALGVQTFYTNLL